MGLPMASFLFPKSRKKGARIGGASVYKPEPYSKRTLLTLQSLRLFGGRKGAGKRHLGRRV